MELLYADKRIAVAVKPPGVLSTDEPGGMPELLRAQLGITETPNVAPHDIHIMGLRGLIGQHHARVFAKRAQPFAERNVDIHRQLLLAVERQNLLANEGLLLAVEGSLATEGLLATERQLVPAPSVACPMVRTQRIGGVPLWLMLALLKQRCYVVVCLHSFLCF